MGNYNTATSQVTRKIDKPVYEKAIDAANRLERAMEQGWNENYHVLEENLLNVIRKMDSETRQAFLTWAYTTKMESGRAVGKELFDEVVLLFAISNLSQPEINAFSKLDDIYHRCKEVDPDQIRNRDSLRIMYGKIRPQVLRIVSPVVAANVQEKLRVIDPALGFRGTGMSATKRASKKPQRTTPRSGCCQAVKKPAAKKPVTKKPVSRKVKNVDGFRF
jgi:hypothetical protein